MEYESRNKSKEIERLYEAVLTLESIEDCYRFFDDLCTIGEINSMAQRFEVAEFLNDKKTFSEIEDETKASSATITRVNKCLNYGADGYKMVIKRMNE